MRPPASSLPTEDICHGEVNDASAFDYNEVDGTSSNRCGRDDIAVVSRNSSTVAFTATNGFRSANNPTFNNHQNKSATSNDLDDFDEAVDDELLTLDVDNIVTMSSSKSQQHQQQPYSQPSSFSGESKSRMPLQPIGNGGLHNLGRKGTFDADDNINWNTDSNNNGNMYKHSSHNNNNNSYEGNTNDGDSFGKSYDNFHSSNSNTYISNNNNDQDTPLCPGHNLPCRLLTAQTASNNGRQFYKCSLPGKRLIVYVLLFIPSPSTTCPRSQS
jgi:hypothetical protein